MSEIRNQILLGDVRERLAEIPDASVDCVITSPPYFRLRDYGRGGQLGLESSIDQWADVLRDVLRGVARVLKPGGSVWLILGDTYSRDDRHGAPKKSLLLGPERLGLRLLEDGWIVRNKVTWAKTNPMPTSARDRLSNNTEIVYFLTRSDRYFFDLDSIRVPRRSNQRRDGSSVGSARPAWGGRPHRAFSPPARRYVAGDVGHPLGKNPGDVWEVATANFRGPHFATFPPKLVDRPLLASCPARVCSVCGTPWRRAAMRRLGALAVRGEPEPGCRCGREWRPGLVLDPFIGSGTLALAALGHQRDWLGIELNADYADLANRRIEAAVRAGRRDDRRAA
jgi:site-specific DNA-methyltransferase (adenine-specific)